MSSKNDSEAATNSPNYWGVHSGTGSLRGGGVTHIYCSRRPSAKELADRVERRIGLLLILCLATNATILLIYTVTHFAALRAGLHDYMDDLRDGLYQNDNKTLAVGALPMPLALTADDPEALFPDGEPDKESDDAQSTTETSSGDSATVGVETTTTSVDEEIKEKEAPDFVTIAPLEEAAESAEERSTVTTVMLIDMLVGEMSVSTDATVSVEADTTSTVSTEEVDTVTVASDLTITSHSYTAVGVGGDLDKDASSTVLTTLKTTGAYKPTVSYALSTASPMLTDDPEDALEEAGANNAEPAEDAESPLTVAEVNRYDAVLESILHTLALFAALNVLFLVVAVPLTYAYYYPRLFAATRRKPSEHAFVATSADEMTGTADATDHAAAERRVKAFRIAYQIFIVSVLIFSVIELFYFVDPLLHYATLLPHAIDRLLSVVGRSWSDDVLNALEERFVCTTAGRRHNSAPPDGGVPRAERREWLSSFAYMLQDECAPKLKDHFVRPIAVVILILCALAPILFIVFTYAWTACIKDWRLIRTARQRANAWSQRWRKLAVGDNWRTEPR